MTVTHFFANGRMLIFEPGCGAESPPPITMINRQNF
jgi:hypothetical protein